MAGFGRGQGGGDGLGIPQFSHHDDVRVLPQDVDERPVERGDVSSANSGPEATYDRLHPGRGGATMSEVTTHAPTDTTLLRNYVGGAWRASEASDALASQLLDVTRTFGRTR